MNFRISNNLFESIRNVTNPQVEEPAKVEEAEVDKAHFCATHVEHAMLGLGTCISEQHAEPDEQGQIAWYTVEFPTGTHRIQTSNLRIVEGKSHTHGKKMAEAQIDELSVNTLNRVHRAAVSDANDATRDGDDARSDKRYNLAGKASNKAELKNRAAGLKPSGQHSMDEGNDGNLANNAKPYNKVTHGDVIAGRLGKDEMGGKKKVVKEEEIDEKLTGGQPKIDKNNNNKIDKEDFAILRKEKKVNEAEDDMHPDAGTLLKHIKPEHHDTYKPYLTKTVFNGSIKDRRDVLDAADAAGHLKDDRGPRGVTQEAHNNPFDVKNYKSQIPTKPGERAGFDSKKISTGTVYTKKFTKEKPEPAGKAFKPKAVKEGISQTIINYDDFRIDVTDNPTYGDYLRALQTMVESRDENIQQEVVAIATAAYNDKIDSIIIESKARQIFAGKLDEIRKSGSTVLDESYIVESNSTYVEYTVEKDGVRTQYVHIGTNGNK